MLETPHLQTVAVIGGGQLGSMLAEAAQPLRIAIHCLDPDPDAPARYNAQSLAEGSLNDARTLEAFARHADIVTIEIENVSVEGLRRLRDDHGRIVHPRPEALALIQDKGLQKLHFQQNGIATAPFALYDSADDIRQAVAKQKLALPFVQKTRTGGYDGKGVLIVKRPEQLAQLLEGPAVVEALAPLRVELAVVAARRPSGEIATFPVVEMDFDPVQNLVTQLISPARIDAGFAEAAQKIASQLIESLDICGLLAVEFFLLEDDQLWVNEIAPRPHNSGHITMNGFATSQFEQHLRAILDLPLGATTQYRPAVMLNLLGADGPSGPVIYPGLEACLALPGVHIHLYGKTRTSPHRKMGHVNIVAETLEEALGLAELVREKLSVKAI